MERNSGGLWFFHGYEPIFDKDFFKSFCFRMNRFPSLLKVVSAVRLQEPTISEPRRGGISVNTTSTGTGIGSMPGGFAR